MHVCTVVGPDAVGWARCLVREVRARHPEATCVVLVVDDPDRPRPVVEGAEVWGLSDLELDAETLDIITLVYAPEELRAALTPVLVRSLHDRTGDVVVLLDHRVVLLGELAGLEAATRDHGLVLVRRTPRPTPRDGRSPNEQELLLAGVFDTALVGVAPDARGSRFVAWWEERCLTGSFDQPSLGFHLARRWLDLVPGAFDHYVMPDDTWNLNVDSLGDRRTATDAQGRLLVDGKLATFLMLDHYDPALPHLFDDRAEGPGRVLLSESPALRKACDTYGTAILTATALEEAEAPVPFSVRDGIEVDEVVRRLVRAELIRPLSGAPARPGPFDEPLGEWLRRPDEESQHVHLSRYLAAVYDARPDLQVAFPGVTRGRTRGLLAWAAQHGVEEVGISRDLLGSVGRDDVPVLSRVPVGRGRVDRDDQRDRAAADSVAGRPAVEVVGYLTAELGQGESARQFVTGLEAAGASVSTATYTRLSSRLGVPWTDRVPEVGTRAETVLLCVSPEALPQLTRDLGATALRGRYRIGLWFWELTDFPRRLHPSLELVDEVWVASRFNAETLQALTDKPVVVMPHPTHAPAASEARVPELPDAGVPTFLFVFDYLSILERKNPMATVEAFVRAFPEPGAARLVIKSINGERKQVDRERLRYLVAGRDDIVLIERYLSRAELDGLMHGADCYASLHRSEGFGQTLAESMAIGKPVIATAYSGNLEFTRPDNSYLVPATLVEVPPGNAPYLPPAQWGDPDVDAAAAAMRAVVSDPEEARRRGERAKATIESEFSVPALGRALGVRLDEIAAERAAAGPAETAETAETVETAAREWRGRLGRRVLRRPRRTSDDDGRT